MIVAVSEEMEIDFEIPQDRKYLIEEAGIN